MERADSALMQERMENAHGAIIQNKGLCFKVDSVSK